MIRCTVLAMTLFLPLVIWCQGTIEAEKVTADTIEGDGSRLTNLPNQNLDVSSSGDTLYITEGNWVLIPGLSASNSGNVFANAGVDIVNACQTSFNLQASPLQSGQTGQWSIISGTGGGLVNNTLPNALFVGQEGESYVLKWTVQNQGGSSSFDELNISIAVNTETSTANAGIDLSAIMDQTITLTGNAPEAGSEGRWEILSGNGGIIADQNDPNTSFTGVPGESYTLRWQHFNDCSTSSDEVTLTFSESAGGQPSSNGRYYIPDPQFRQYLQIAYPSVMDGDSLIVAMGPTVEKLRLTNLGVLNLDGLQFLTELRSLIMNGNVTSIPYFSPKLERFECDQCEQLSVIPDFPESLDTIRGTWWQVESIPHFPLGLLDIYLEDFYRVSQVPEIPDSCTYVWLEQIGTCCPSRISGTLNIPELCKEFNVRYTYLDSFPTLPDNRSNLERLTIWDCGIASMPSLEDFTDLIWVWLPENGLLKLGKLPFVLQNMRVDGNPLICVENKPPLVEDQLSEYDICPE